MNCSESKVYLEINLDGIDINVKLKQLLKYIHNNKK